MTMQHYSHEVSPFRNFRIKGCKAPPRNVSPPDHVFHRLLEPRHPPYALMFLLGNITTTYIRTAPSICVCCFDTTFRRGSIIFHVSVSQTPLDPSEYFYYWITVLLCACCARDSVVKVTTIYLTTLRENKIRLHGGLATCVTRPPKI